MKPLSKKPRSFSNSRLELRLFVNLAFNGNQKSCKDDPEKVVVNNDTVLHQPWESYMK